VVEIVERNRRKSNPGNKIGVTEVKVRGDEVGQATQKLSASSVASMTIMQMNTNRLSVSVVVRSNTMQGIADSKIRGKRQPTFSQKMLNMKWCCKL